MKDETLTRDASSFFAPDHDFSISLFQKELAPEKANFIIEAMPQK